MLLVGADDDVELATCRYLERIDGVVEKAFADVELVVLLAHGVFGSCSFFSHDILDMGGDVGDGTNSLCSSADGLSGCKRVSVGSTQIR